MSGMNCRGLNWAWTNIFPNRSVRKILVARVGAILRRTLQEQIRRELLKAGGIEIDEAYTS